MLSFGSGSGNAQQQQDMQRLIQLVAQQQQQLQQLQQQQPQQQQQQQQQPQNGLHMLANAAAQQQPLQKFYTIYNTILNFELLTTKNPYVLGEVVPIPTLPAAVFVNL